jgi:hypothetical protein
MLALAQQQSTPPAPPQRITKDMVVAALATMGLQFTDAQLDLLLPAVNRQLASFDTLRTIDIPLDTPPAISPLDSMDGLWNSMEKQAVESRLARAIVGSPETVAGKLKEFPRITGVEQIFAVARYSGRAIASSGWPLLRAATPYSSRAATIFPARAEAVCRLRLAQRVISRRIGARRCRPWPSVRPWLALRP